MLLSKFHAFRLEYNFPAFPNLDCIKWLDRAALIYVNKGLDHVLLQDLSYFSTAFTL